VDDDGNGFADCEDFGCSRSVLVSVCGMTEAGFCLDGADNDKDGTVDCDDSDCAVASACGGAPPPDGGMPNPPRMDVPAFDPAGHETGDERCGNMVDDDGDGRTDCDDEHCEYNPGVTVCAGPREVGDAACANGMDDDGNGFTDCEDFSCKQNPFVTVCMAESNDVLCSNGVDDDGNGFVDCDDFGCSRARTVSVCADSEAGFCLDEVDNDLDGDVDCADADCAAAAFCAGG
jgi:hypothetical protein